MSQAYEKLGAFYLGKKFDPEKGEIVDDLLLYDAKDLTTHAVCVGMTGSGKTGLCVSLLEEAGIDRIPAIAIDPKGDLGNLLLTFPTLAPDDFRPWIDETEAARKGLSPEEYAKKVAATWKKGLADWDQDGERIGSLRGAVEIDIYTPGSSAGIPLTVLRSFRAPPPELLEDSDALRERTLASVSGLLALLGIDADPIRSREHILISSILNTRWREGKNLDVVTLIREIREPPLANIGLLDLESFYPAKARFELAMTLNNLLASPAFAAWMEGEPLDVLRLLYTPQGKPKISILSIAHLSDPERMFFVTLLLSEVVAWMRMQPGSSSLRALLYMDETFGFFPPTANPPSKTPMLTLMKQARASGLGVVLATQNPVDLDYKGLSNAGTWFLGRLQTERDKERVLDGLEGASAIGGAGFDRGRTEAILSGLDSRVFLMNNVHEDGPVVFHTRWALSYLRGPLTRAEIKVLMEARRAEPASRPTAPPWSAPATAVGVEAAAAGDAKRPVLPPDVREGFLTAQDPGTGDEQLVYRPALHASSRLHFVDAREKIDEWSELTVLAALPEQNVPNDPWEEAIELRPPTPKVATEPEAKASFSHLPAEAINPKSYTGWSRSLKAYLYREGGRAIWRCPVLETSSKIGESEGDYRVRLTQTAREQRDLAIEKLRTKYAPKLVRLEERIQRAMGKVEREQARYRHETLQTAISVGATVLGALFGRKLASARTVGRATTTARGVGRMSREKGQAAAAEESVELLREKLAALEVEFEEESGKIRGAYDPDALELTKAEIRPRKTDIVVGDLRLVWVPWRKRRDGMIMPAFRTG